MALIKCENVSIGYEGQMVVHDLDFEINQGDYLCIVGENGSGKSTLVKSLLGLKNVDKGKIVFDGKNSSYRRFRELPVAARQCRAG